MLDDPDDPPAVQANQAQATAPATPAPHGDRRVRGVRRLPPPAPALESQQGAGASAATAAIEPKMGDWVLVKFKSRRHVHYSVGQVLCIDTKRELVCKFLQPIKIGHFVWPDNVKRVAVDYDVVVMVLKAPRILKAGRRGPETLTFCEDFSKYDLQ